jgi:hypothetical protein
MTESIRRLHLAVCRTGFALAFAGLAAAQSGPVTAPESAREARFDSALARGDWRTAKMLDRQMAEPGLQGLRVPGTGPSPRVTAPRGAWVDLGLWDGAVAVDTGPVTAFDVEADLLGGAWVAAADTAGRITVCRSTDWGRTWESRLEIQANSTVTQLRLLNGMGDTNFLFLFLLEQSNSGDVWLVRARPESLTGEVFPVAVGPDTVNKFSAALDRDSLYYLYCLYTNERRAGRTGTFTRSLEYGRTWEAGVDWVNAWDPRVVHGSGSTIHCAWRYALTGAAVHYSFNRAYGRPRHWLPYQVVSATDDQCSDPVIALTDTWPEWNATIWAFYTASRRDSSIRDVLCSYSRDDGNTWATAPSFSEPLRDEWGPDLLVDEFAPNGNVGACFSVGAPRFHDSTTIYWTASNAWGPDQWLKPAPVTKARAALEPRIIYVKDSPLRLPAFVYSRAGTDGPTGVYFAAPWLETGPAPVAQPEPGRPDELIFTVARAGRYSLSVYDAAGRRARGIFAGTLAPGIHSWNWGRLTQSGARAAPGTYFAVLSGPGLRESRRIFVGR